MKGISRRARPHTITLYNFVSSAAGVATYQRTVLQQVHLDKGYQQRLSQRGVSTTDTALLILDLSDTIATSNRTFIPAESWAALTTLQKAGYFTFRAADDFFIDGTATETLPSTTKAAMQAKYRLYAVSTASDPAHDTAAARVLEVTAK